MTIMWGACSFLLLTMAAVSSGRNAADYFREAKFQYSPSRPEDVLVLFISNGATIICEADPIDVCRGFGLYRKDDFCLSLEHGYSLYTCSTEGNLELRDVFDSYVLGNAKYLRRFREKRMYCTTISQLPDEYFHMSVQRPHEDHLVKCHFLNDNGTFFLRFPGYPTVTCYIGNEAWRYQFSLPGVDDAFRCAFRVYSELPLGDKQTEKQLYQSLASRLPASVDGSRPRLVCSRQAASNATSSFELQWHGGATYHCSFPDAAPACLPATLNTPQD